MLLLNNTMQNRRDFLKQSGTACAAIAGLGFLTALESCKAPAAAVATTYDAASNKISFPFTSFGTGNTVVVEGPGKEYRVFVIKKSDTDLTALKLKCTHRGGNVQMEQAKLHCPNHGSEFDFEGKVLEGPAAAPLKKFPVTVENGNVFVAVA